MSTCSKFNGSLKIKVSALSPDVHLTLCSFQQPVPLQCPISLWEPTKCQTHTAISGKWLGWTVHWLQSIMIFCKHIMIELNATDRYDCGRDVMIPSHPRWRLMSSAQVCYRWGVTQNLKSDLTNGFHGVRPPKVEPWPGDFGTSWVPGGLIKEIWRFLSQDHQNKGFLWCLWRLLKSKVLWSVWSWATHNSLWSLPVIER